MIDRRSLLFYGACSLVAGCGAGSGTDSPGGQQITIASNPAGTHVYAVAAGLAKVLQEQLGVRATIRPFSGSSAYLPLLERGEVMLGLNISIDAYLSYHGLPPYQQPLRNLRLLGMMFPLPIMYMVRADSDLRRVEDLRGKRVVVTFRANVALAQLHKGILATGGLSEADVESLTVAGLPEAMRLLTEGRADAVPTGLDTALVLQVHSSLPGGIRYLTLGADEAKLPETMPGSQALTMTPSDTSVGLDGTTRVSGVVDYLTTSTHVSDEQAYSVIKTIHENWPALQRDYVQIRDTTAEAVAPADNTLPYHPGAVRYYREAGLWTEQHEENQQRLLAG